MRMTPAPPPPPPPPSVFDWPGLPASSSVLPAPPAPAVAPGATPPLACAPSERPASPSSPAAVPAAPAAPAAAVGGQHGRVGQPHLGRVEPQHAARPAAAASAGLQSAGAAAPPAWIVPVTTTIDLALSASAPPPAPPGMDGASPTPPLPPAQPPRNVSGRKTDETPAWFEVPRVPPSRGGDKAATAATQKRWRRWRLCRPRRPPALEASIAPWTLRSCHRDEQHRLAAAHLQRASVATKNSLAEIARTSRRRTSRVNPTCSTASPPRDRATRPSRCRTCTCPPRGETGQAPQSAAAMSHGSNGTAGSRVAHSSAPASASPPPPSAPMPPASLPLPAPSPASSTADYRVGADIAGACRAGNEQAQRDRAPARRADERIDGTRPPMLSGARADRATAAIQSLTVSRATAGPRALPLPPEDPRDLAQAHFSRSWPAAVCFRVGPGATAARVGPTYGRRSDPDLHAARGEPTMSYRRRRWRPSPEGGSGGLRYGGRAPGKASRAQKRFGWTWTKPAATAQRDDSGAAGQRRGTGPGPSRPGGHRGPAEPTERRWWAASAPIQARTDQDASIIQDRSAERAAQVGGPAVSSGGGPLPHREKIQTAFGRHDVSGVRAFVGGEAGQQAQAIGASAFATGDAVGFADSPGLHTAAHEAAHMVQQRTGVVALKGVNPSGERPRKSRRRRSGCSGRRQIGRATP